MQQFYISDRVSRAMDMRVFRFLLAGLLMSGCSSATVHVPHNSSLVARARAGREPPSTGRAWAVVAFASNQIGKSYCWGGAGPSCFDCSGLVRQAWGAVG